MKRVILLVLILIMVATAASAAYKIQLKSGKIITADDKPVIKEDMAYFTKVGLYLYLPASQIDLVKTDEINMVSASAGDLSVEPSTLLPPPPAPVKPVYIDEDQLLIIRKRSRLANEGGLMTSPPPTAGRTPGAGLSDGARQLLIDNSEQQRLQSQILDLAAQQRNYQTRLMDLRSQRASALENFNFSVMQGDQERYQKQMDSLDSQINDLQGQVEDIQRQLNDVQGELQRSLANQGGQGGQGGGS